MSSATSGIIAEIYHAGYRRLVAQVYAFTTDLTEAQDAVQEAFARALARRQGLSDMDAPEAWLRTVAINIVRRRWRRRQVLDRILLRERPLARFVEEMPENIDLREALAVIPRHYREVIVLHYLADMPVEEVSSILEVPVGTVKSRLSRGRDALKGLLDDVEAPPLARVTQRAGQIRARRRVAQTTAALAVVLVSAVWFLPSKPAFQPTVRPTPPPSYSASGLVIHGVFEASTVTDLDGTIVQFDMYGSNTFRTDEDVYAHTDDGGQTWQLVKQPAPPPGGPWIGGWPSQAIQHTWVPYRPTPSGVWWLAGFAGGKPAVAFSAAAKDRDSWRAIPLENPGPTDRVVATFRGEQVIAMTLNKDKITGVYAGNSAGFQRVSDGGGMTIDGEPILLPDGRLLVASEQSRFQLSSDYGKTWSQAGNGLPNVGSLHMTSTGFVALDLFRSGWVAISGDGLTWQKLEIR